MDGNTGIILSVKTSLDGNIKRFDLPSSSTLQDVIRTTQKLYKENILGLKYRDEDGDLVTLRTEEDFTEALKSVPKTSGILRLYLNNTTESESSINESCTTNDINSSDASKLVQVEKQTVQRQDSKSRKKQKMSDSTNPSDAKKMIVPHKIESATKLSKDLKLVNSEVTGRIPVSSPASNCGLDKHFSSQKPGCRKIRQLSSTSSSNEKKTSNCTATESRKKKRQNFPYTSSSESSCSTNSSCSSSESSSEEVTEDSAKRPDSPTTNAVNKMLIKFEKNIHAKVAKNLNKQTEEIKCEMITAITQSVVKQLNGAIIQSVRANGDTLVDEARAASGTDIKSNSRRLRYHHHNVSCDNCEREIFGPRFKCGNCSDYDLCERCEDIEGIHTPSHVFLKIHHPCVHAGRKSVGGKAKPLLDSTIYEEREKEREKEELLQRKFDSGSELCENTPELREKQKEREAQFKREAREAKKEELRKLKKELRRNKRENVRKQKQQNTLQKLSGGEIQSLTLAPAEFSGDVFAANVCTRKTDSVTLQDENVMTALSGLKILTSQLDENANAEDGSPSSADAVLVGDLTIQSSNEDGDFESLHSVSETNQDDHSTEQIMQPSLQSNSIGQFEDVQSKPDLVDFVRDAEVIDDDMANQSEDFVVVSKVFDLNTPLNPMEIMQHLRCNDCEGQNCDLHNGECQAFSLAIRNEVDERDNVLTYEPNEVEEAQQLSHEPLAVFDLVASVPNEIRSQPDIASCITNTNPCTLEENLDDIPHDTDSYEHLSETITTTSNSNTVEDHDAAVIMEQPMSPPILVSFPLPPTPTITPPVSPVVLKQPEAMKFENVEQDGVISTQPTIHDEIINLQRDLETACSANLAQQQQTNNSTNQPKTLLEQATAVNDKNKSKEDSTTPCSFVVESQRKKEEFFRNQHDQYLDESNKLEPVLPQDSESTPLDEENKPCSYIIEAQRRKEEFLRTQHQGDTNQHEVIQPLDMTIEVEQNDSSFGDALTGAMASVVDAAASAAAAVGETVINVVNQASGPQPTAEYHNGDVSVVLPGEKAESDCMTKLVDMGFCDRDLNKKLLRRYNNDMQRCVSELINATDDQWHQTRH